MGRPKKANPKNKHIGIVTTEDKFRRFKALGLKGDEAIDVLLYHIEKGNMELNIKKSLIINRIKAIDKEVEELEFEKLKLQTQLEQVNMDIGINDNDGLNNRVSKAVKTVMQRFNNQHIYNLFDFINMNEDLIKIQAHLCDVDFEEFKNILLYET